MPQRVLKPQRLVPIPNVVGVHQGPDATLIGTTLSHYRILQRIGDGATSVVYKAEDLSLGRVVALKLLPASLSIDLGKVARFQHEARTASTLSHPNICTIYEIGEHEGRHFIAMEYLEGQPLSSVIAGRPIEAYRLVELAIQIADGLDAAHAERVVHRDLKPANIHVSGREHVKLLDFGLSVLMPFGTGSRTPPSATWLAEPGGTVPYMSPEQTTGEQIDTRSDLFSFGVVLYEMATGSRPFGGATHAALMDAIRQEAPFPARDLNTGVPDELNRIIEKSLEKNRKLRYQTASDIGADLRRLKRDLDAFRPPPAAPAGVEPARTAAGARRHAVIHRGWAVAQIIGAAGIGGALGAFGLPGPRVPPDLARTPVRAAVHAPADPAQSEPPAPRPAAGPATASAPAAPLAPQPAGPSLPVTVGPGPLGVDTADAYRPRAWADQQIEIAQSKIDLMLYDQAIETLTDVIRNHGSTAAAPKAYLLLAGVHEARGHNEDAIATYLEMAARYPEHPRAAEALFDMAHGILASRRHDRNSEAQRIYTDIVERFPGSPWAPRALLARGDLEERLDLRRRDPVAGTSAPVALGTYRQLAEDYPHSAEREHALWRVSRMYADLKRYDLAAPALHELATDYASSRYDSWFTLAELYEKRLKLDDQARMAYAQVPSTSPRYGDAQKRLSGR